MSSVSQDIQLLNLNSLNSVSFDVFDKILLKNIDQFLDIKWQKEAINFNTKNILINTIINKLVVTETYFENIRNNIYYYDNNNNKDNKIENIKDIDLSRFANHNIHEFMFYFDFLSEYYRNLSEIKKDKFALKGEIYNNIFKIKVRFILAKELPFSQQDINNKNSILYTTVTRKNDDFITENKDYLNFKFKFKFNNEYKPDRKLLNLTSENLTNLSNNLFEFIRMDVPGNRDTIQHANYEKNIKYLINKLQFTNDLSIEKEEDYYHLVAKSYKYKFYKLLLNYYVFITYHVYTENEIQTGEFKMFELTNIIKDFEKVFENYYISLLNIENIINSVDKLDIKAESIKIDESIEDRDKLKELNKKIDLKYQKNKRMKNSIESGNIINNKSNNTLIISIIILVIVLFTYLSTINIYSIETSKIISLIIFSLVIVTHLFITYFDNNK